MTGNNKVWRAPLAGLASVAMLATMGLVAGTASADSAATVDKYDFDVTLHANSPANVSEKATVNGVANADVDFNKIDLDNNAKLNELSALTWNNYSIANVTLSGPGAPSSDWVFTGWYTSPEYGSEKFDPSTTVTKHVDLYAHWAEPDETVKLDFQGGSLTSSNTVFVAQQDEKIASWELPTDNAGDGKVVDTWNFKSESSASASEPATGTVTLDELTKGFTGKLTHGVGPFSVTLTPVDPGKENATRVVYYYAGTDSNREDLSLDVKYGETIPTTPDTGKNGVAVAKWVYRDTAHPGYVLLPEGFTAKASYPILRLFAAGASTSVFAVTYYDDVNGSRKTLATEYVEAGKTPVNAPTVEHDDYQFLGWIKSDHVDYNASTVDLSSLKINEDTELFAQFTTNKATVYFDYNYGNKVEKKSFAAGEDYSFTAPTAQRAGYQFLGWYYNAGTSDDSSANSNPFKWNYQSTSARDQAVFVKAFLDNSKDRKDLSTGWVTDRSETTDPTDPTYKTPKPGAKWLEDYTFTKANGKTTSVSRAYGPSVVFPRLKSVPAGAKLSFEAGKLQYQYTEKVADPDAANGYKVVTKYDFIPSKLYAAWGQVNAEDIKDTENNVPTDEAGDVAESDASNYTAASRAAYAEAYKKFLANSAKYGANPTDEQAAELHAELEAAQALLVQTTPLKVVRLVKGSKHVYSTDVKEQTVLKNSGWKVEGVAFYATDKTAPKSQAVYRLYNPSNGNHLLSTDANEVNVLSQRGWNDEGVVFYAPQGGTDAVKRFWKAGAEHLYTADANEYTYNTTKAGWTGDDTVFVAAKTQVK